MSKRKFEHLDEIELEKTIPTPGKSYELKNSLDSDEEDDKDEDTYNVLHEDDIEGAEDGENRMDGETRLTAFNMNEEMEEGHFDKDGHFIWKKEKEIQDNWLDSIDWQKIRQPTAAEKAKGLGDDDDDSDSNEQFDEIVIYKKILGHMRPQETIAKCIKRLGGNQKRLSSAERWKLKKAGKLENPTSSHVTDLTELANEILTKTGNMDVYQETFEMIGNKIKKKDGAENTKTVAKDAEFDMYADDFEVKEKNKLTETGKTIGPVLEPSTSYGETRSTFDVVMWEYKSEGVDKIHGPHTSASMLKWTNDGKFKEGIMVRKVGQSEFYKSNRVDFDLYV